MKGRSYKQPDQLIEELKAENKRLREALEAIIEHQKRVSSTFGVHGAAYHIAKQALEQSDET